MDKKTLAGIAAGVLLAGGGTYYTYTGMKSGSIGIPGVIKPYSHLLFGDVEEALDEAEPEKSDTGSDLLGDGTETATEDDSGLGDLFNDDLGDDSLDIFADGGDATAPEDVIGSDEMTLAQAKSEKESLFGNGEGDMAGFDGLMAEEEPQPEKKTKTDQQKTDKQKVAEQPKVMSAQEVKTAQAKGNIIELESKATMQQVSPSEVKTKPSAKESIKKIVTVSPHLTRVPVKAGKAHDAKQSYAIVHYAEKGESFLKLTDKYNIRYDIPTLFEFLRMNPSECKGLTENAHRRFDVMLTPGASLKVPERAKGSHGMYYRGSKGITTYAFELYSSLSKSSARDVQKLLCRKGHNAYIRDFGRGYSVMVGFYTSPARAEKDIRKLSLYIGRSEDAVNLVKVVHGRQNTDQYVKRYRKSYYVQIFSSTSKNISDKLLKKLQKVKLKNPLYISKAWVKGSTWYRIRMDNFPNKMEAITEGKFLQQNVEEVQDFVVGQLR